MGVGPTIKCIIVVSMLFSPCSFALSLYNPCIYTLLYYINIVVVSRINKDIIT